MLYGLQMYHQLKPIQKTNTMLITNENVLSFFINKKTCDLYLPVDSKLFFDKSFLMLSLSCFLTCVHVRALHSPCMHLFSALRCVFNVLMLLPKCIVENACRNNGFRAVVLNVWQLATHKIQLYTFWRPIYYYYSTKTQVLATQKWVATRLLRTTAVEAHNFSGKKKLIFNMIRKDWKLTLV